MRKRRKLSIKKIIKNLKPYIKMDKRIINFDDTEIKKCSFHQNKSFILINDIDSNKAVVSNKLPFGKHDFISFIG